MRYRCSALPTELTSQLVAGYYVGSQYVQVFSYSELFRVTRSIWHSHRSSDTRKNKEPSRQLHNRTKNNCKVGKKLLNIRNNINIIIIILILLNIINNNTIFTKIPQQDEKRILCLHISFVYRGCRNGAKCSKNVILLDKNILSRRNMFSFDKICFYLIKHIFIWQNTISFVKIIVC